MICDIDKVMNEIRAEIIKKGELLYSYEIRQILNENQIGACKTCSHRDPEDKKCDCGGLERVGCQFPVSDVYYCKYYERRTWDDEEEVDDDKAN